MPELQLSHGMLFSHEAPIVFPWSDRLFTTISDTDDIYSYNPKPVAVTHESLHPDTIWNDPVNYYWKDSSWIMPDTSLIDFAPTAENDRIKTYQVLVFSQLDDNKTWETSWRTMLEYHGHSLLMDTGAAKNLAGTYILKSYEREYLLPYGMHIGTEPSTASFTGISGTSQGAKVMTDSPVYPGGALGEMRYKAHALDNNNLPMLLCCGSMRASGFIIKMNNDTVYLPMNVEAAKAGRPTQWLELPLHWTGVLILFPLIRPMLITII